MSENIKCRMSPTSSSRVSTQKSSSHKDNSQLTTDIKALQPDNCPEGELDIQHGEEEVLRLCDRSKVDRRISIQGFWEYKEQRGSKTPEALKPLLKAVHTIAVSTSERERAFSCMNNILTDKRISLAVTRLSNLIFLKSNGPPLEQFSPQSYVMAWLVKGRRSTDERECKAPSHSSKDDPNLLEPFFK